MDDQIAGLAQAIGALEARAELLRPASGTEGSLLRAADPAHTEADPAMLLRAAAEPDQLSGE